jgi:CRP/FNR family transcriptional regulator, cyclic AMP receptor protein
MPTVEHIPLLDASVELTRHITVEERAELARASLPVITVGPGELDLVTLLADHGGFGATVLDGLVMSAVRIGEQTGIQLLGPGDLLMPTTEASPDWLTEAQLRTIAPVQLAVLGRDLLAAVYRWPRVIQGMYACLGDQLARLRAQLVICQLPRVDERVLAMFWLLAESWGQVTPSGVRLPLTLTHETLGALIGARRPTVTLALRKLAQDGAAIHQDSGWLLLERPPQPVEPRPKLLPPEIADRPRSLWAVRPAPDGKVSQVELREALRTLREQHAADRQAAQEQRELARDSRERMSAARQQIAQDALRRRWPPSS